MKIKLLLIFLILFVYDLSVSDAQFYKSSKIQMGVSGGIFRISIDGYREHYNNRVAFPVGGSFGYAISPSFLIMVRGKFFQKISDGFDENSNRNIHRIWQQSWMGVGIQQYSFSISGKIRSYFGFGLALFFIDELEDGDFLLKSGSKDRSIQPKGFYLNVGFDRFLTKRLTFCFEIEMSSAGIGRGTSLESQSIGGIYGGIGFNLHIF